MMLDFSSFRATPLRSGAVLGLIAFASTGCGHDRGQITPTTTGTDLRAMPRGKMTPLPFPGSSLARARTADPDTVPASAESQVR